MLRRVTKSCLPVVLSAGIISTVGATAIPASAATTETGVTVILKAHHLAALRHLSHTHGLSHAQRVRAVERLLPSATQRATVVRALHEAGLTVTSQTAWSVSASGSSTAVSHAFGSHAVMHPHATAAQRRAVNGPYPSLPAAMGDAAAGVYPTDTGAPMFHNHATPDFLTGNDFRNAYTTPDLTAHGQAPYSGSDPAATLTIATIQFAAWNPGDLATWAATDGIGVPGYQASRDLTMVPVDQSSVPTPTSDDDGDVEVDLDQEALLSTDPFAHQRPYFAPNNTVAGYVDAVSQVLDDVLQDGLAYQGGDPHIVALSTSWGACELSTGSDQINAMEPILASLASVGVTIFAASGDDGIYDQCGSDANVDYPASSPEVIGVGGTALGPVGTSAPNNGTNWTETAWSCSSAAECGGDTGGGSGGGVSLGFTKPDFQSLIDAAPFSQTTGRMVPDISANGDPNTPFPVYTTDPGSGEGYYPVGGTSLAAPLSAALYTNALAAHAVKWGAVDVLPALYTAAAAGDGSFRDITTGSNGAASDAGDNPSVDAATGYDTVAGLGAPLWPKIVDRVLDPLAWPTATAKLLLTHPKGASSPYQVSASWTATPATGGLDVDNSAVRITRVGHSGSVYAQYDAPASGSHTFTGKPGSTYRLTVTARDLAGTTSITKTSTLIVPIDDKSLSFFGSWKHLKGNHDFAGTLSQTSHNNAAASVKASGKVYTVLVHTGPSYGKLVISQNGHKIKTVDLHSGQSATKMVTFFEAKSVSTRRFDFFCVDKLVNVDAVYVGR
jgi:kumamolisin